MNKKLLEIKMTAEQVIKKLQKEKSHNPFHKDYDWDSVLKTVEELDIKNNETDVKLNLAVHSCLVTGLISPFFDETYTEIKKRIENSSLSTLQIIRCLIVHVNRNYILLKQQFRSNLRKSNEIDYLDSYRFQVESLDPKIGKMQATASVEGEIDALNVLLNYLRYFEGANFKKPNSQVTELESVNSILTMSFVGAYFNLVKACYEDAIWNRGYIYVENESKSIKIDYHSHEEQKLLKVGQIRLSRNSTGTYFNLIELNNNNDFTSPFSKFKKRKRIKQVLITNGIVTSKLAKGIDKKEADHEIKLLSELNTFYPFIENEDFPKFKDLNLNKFLTMFSSLQYLFRRIAEINIDNDEIMKINDFNKFPHRIKIATLKDYLSNKLDFSNAQIKDFLSLIEVSFDKSSRVNLWNRPLIRYKDEYLFTLLGINDPLVSHLIDLWLNDGGFSLDKRGNLLENYLKKQLYRIIKEKGYFISIPSTSLFKIPSKGKEEIDLILNLKSIVIVAEVKCIKYPIEVRDFHNSYKRLVQASKQVIRKTNFIKNNLDYFSNKIDGIEDKDIKSLVITNFPNFSGFNINNISVVDIYLLEAYILAGKLYKSKISFKKKGESIQDNYDEISFYTDEDEFCENFISCMKEPPAVKEIKAKIEIKENLKAPNFFDYNVYLNEPIVNES